MAVLFFLLAGSDARYDEGGWSPICFAAMNPDRMWTLLGAC